MQEVLLVTCTGNFCFSILLPGREIYFLGLNRQAAHARSGEQGSGEQGNTTWWYDNTNIKLI